MATGWAGDGAVQKQIDDSIGDAIKRAQAQLPTGPSLEHCEECGESVADAKTKMVKGMVLCIPCANGTHIAKKKK